MISQNTRSMIGFCYGYTYNLFCFITNDVDVEEDLSSNVKQIGNSIFRFDIRVDYWRMRNWLWLKLKSIREFIGFFTWLRGEPYAELQEFTICELDGRFDVNIVYNWKFLFTVKCRRLLDVFIHYKRVAAGGRSIESRKRGDRL